MLNTNFKLYLKCILNYVNYAFINNKAQNIKNDNILINSKTFYFLSLHFRFSSLFYSTQLVDIFSYEVPRVNNSFCDKLVFSSEKYILDRKSVTPIVVYNFHVLNTQNRLFIFIETESNFFFKNSFVKKSTLIPSITELFFSANWLEREVSELNGVVFEGKKDLRNLMLQYGDNSAPFQKSFPTIGLKEMYYNIVKDTIVQNSISIQI